jgi:hypothetical protein
MSQQGTTTVDFGAFPGKTDTTATVTGITGSPAQGEAYLIPVATADHTAEEHVVDGPVVMAVPPSGGNMTVYARTASPGRAYGLWSIGWVVN